MEKALRRYEPPMAGSVPVTGHVRVLMAAGDLLQPPKDIKKHELMIGFIARISSSMS
jgi:hypothetical protein